MIKNRFIAVVLIFCGLVFGMKAEDCKKTMLREGLPAKVTIKVEDPYGKPVPDASVMFCFLVYNVETPNTVIVKTDANGMASGEANANQEIVVHVTKDGWYRPHCRYKLWGAGKDYQSGRWEPWNPILNITLYPQINPRQNPKKNTRSYERLSPNEVYGFDLLKKSIVLPGEKDKTADFSFIGSGCKIAIMGKHPQDTKFFATNNLEVVFSNKGNGIIRRNKNTDSEFSFTYLAPETGYKQRLHFYEDYSPQRQDGKGEPFLADNEYLIFHISRMNNETGETTWYYGIITEICGYSDLNGERTFNISYYLNQDPGDRNIEY